MDLPGDSVEDWRRPVTVVVNRTAIVRIVGRQAIRAVRAVFTALRTLPRHHSAAFVAAHPAHRDGLVRIGLHWGLLLAPLVGAARRDRLSATALPSCAAAPMHVKRSTAHIACIGVPFDASAIYLH